MVIIDIILSVILGLFFLYLLILFTLKINAYFFSIFFKNFLDFCKRFNIYFTFVKYNNDNDGIIDD